VFRWSKLNVGSNQSGTPSLATMVWTFDAPLLAASTALVGGGIGPRSWVVNAQVPKGYQRTDTDCHMSEIFAELGLDASLGYGVGMLTAADLVRCGRRAVDGATSVEATVGLTRPVRAAARDGDGDDHHSDPDPGLDHNHVPTPLTSRIGARPPKAGTINIVAFVAARHDDAALLNLLCTVTEAKAQALSDAGVPGTGTASDAVTLLCPMNGAPEPFGGPRSTYGAPLARAVHASVLSGASGQGPSGSGVEFRV
jgi:adenosylcobinamide hydrolase